MYLKVASSLPVMILNPPPGGPVVASTAAAGMSGLGRRRVIRIRLPLTMRHGRGLYEPIQRGMGAVSVVNDPCDCYYPLPGVIPQNPNLPHCDPATGIAPACAGVDQPPCSGIPYGAPGYTACLQSASQLAAANAANVGGQSSADATTAAFNKLIASVPAPAPPAVATPPATPPARKRAKVAAPPAAAATPPPAAAATPPPAVGATPPPAAASILTFPATTAGPLSFLTGSVSLFGFQIPVLLIGGVAVAGVLMLSGGGKKR